MRPTNAADARPTHQPDLILDPEAARRAKRSRLRRLNTVTIPILRPIALALMLACAALHAHESTDRWFTAEVQSLAWVLLGYAVLSSLAQRVLYGRLGRIDIGLVVLTLDFLPLLYAIHITGNVHSWMFFLLTVHIADQAASSSARVLYFGILSASTWLAYVGWLHATGYVVPWGIELIKALTLTLLGLHVAVITRTVEKLRERTSRAVQVARESVERLEAQAVVLKRSMADAQAADRARGQFLANITHELRTPMNAVIGMTSLLMDTAQTPEQADYTSTVKASAEHLLHLVNDILDLSKIEAGGMQLASAPYSPTRIVDEVVRMLEQAAAARGIALDIVVDVAVPTLVTGDPGRVRQVLLNLAHNAVKFTEAGGVSVTLRPEGATHLRFDVRDTGIGMTPAQMTSVFDAFVQVDGSLSRRYEGTGLGLAIARRLTTMMGGTIDVASEVGRGSHFWFTVAAPRAEATLTTPATPTPTPALALAHAGGRRLTVLVAEDNVVNQKVARKMLEKLGYDVDIAAHGLAAVEAARHRCYDAILMDCQMPQLDGFDATRAIRALDSPHGRVPIVALTAAGDSDVRARCQQCGMDDLLPKPITLAHLRDALLRWTLPASRIA